MKNNSTAIKNNTSIGLVASLLLSCDNVLLLITVIVAVAIVAIDSSSTGVLIASLLLLEHQGIITAWLIIYITHCMLLLHATFGKACCWLLLITMMAVTWLSYIGMFIQKNLLIKSLLFNSLIYQPIIMNVIYCVHETCESL